MREILNSIRALLGLLALGALVIALVPIFGGLQSDSESVSLGVLQLPGETSAQVPYPPPGTPALPLPPQPTAARLPYPPPGTPAPQPTPQPASTPCPSTGRATLTIEVKVEGLKGEHLAALRLLPDTLQTGTCLSAYGTRLPELSAHNGSHSIILADIPDGSYKLIVDAPANYFRDPQGYLFQVSGGQIIRHSNRAFHFRLIPPADQDLPPCRNLAIRPDTATPNPAAEVVPFEPQVVCRAERLIDISGLPKRPEPRESESLSVGYHYIGPKTSQDNQGVWGRNYVVDPKVDHPGAASRFVAERVYANDSSYNQWIEAGWAEVSWRDDKQYVYEFDSVTQEWHFFDGYTLSSGSAVETRVFYMSGIYNEWWATYYLGGGSWAVLAAESLGFTTADRGYNRGEVYTADGIHPILPPSSFERGYLLVNGWQLWDTRYSISTVVNEDSPYECDMIEQYYRFNIHSPVTFLPIVMKDW